MCLAKKIKKEEEEEEEEEEANIYQKHHVTYST